MLINKYFNLYNKGAMKIFMKVTKVINNNVVCAYNANNKEVVIMGKGIGFKVKEGDLVNKKI